MVAPDYLRCSVSSYDEALAWLFRHARPYEWAFDADVELPLEALLICDTYWVRDDTLRADVRKAWSQALRPARSAPERRVSRTTGWR